MDSRGVTSGTPRLEASSSDTDFRSFFDEAYPRVYRYLLARCRGHAAVAEDLTQETFMSAVREVQRGRADAVSMPWLMVVARHKLIDHYRRQAREHRWLRRPPADAAVFAVGDQDGDGRVLEALHTLAASQQIALILHHVDGLSIPEVARLLGKSVRATESLVARGRQTLRDRYEEGGDE